MSGIILVGMAIVLLFGLIAAEKSGVPGRILLFKTPLSFLFIIAWWLLPYPNKLAFTLVGAALTCCLCGDILLAFGSRVAFLLGLVLFLWDTYCLPASFLSWAPLARPWRLERC